jgi:hypothetical protein
MANPRKNKVLVHLWLTKSEVESLKETIKDCNKGLTGFISNISEIVINAEKRGDLKL